MVKSRRRFDYWSLVTLVSILFFLVFFIYPVSKIFVNSVIDGETGKSPFPLSGNSSADSTTR